jgi:hypothetical protein
MITNALDPADLMQRPTEPLERIGSSCNLAKSSAVGWAWLDGDLQKRSR